jgi:hypothetical protein
VSLLVHPLEGDRLAVRLERRPGVDARGGLGEEPEVVCVRADLGDLRARAVAGVGVDRDAAGENTIRLPFGEPSGLIAEIASVSVSSSKFSK